MIHPFTRARLAREALDTRLADVRTPPPRTGWIKAVREALGMRGSQLAKRMSISPQSLSALESSERKRTITLKSLDQAANAIDCDVHYFFIPRTQASESPSFNKIFEQRADSFRQQYREELLHSMDIEGQKPTTKKSAGRDSVEDAWFMITNIHRMWDAVFDRSSKKKPRTEKK